VRKLELSGESFEMAFNGAGGWWTGRDFELGTSAMPDQLQAYHEDSPALEER